MDPIQRPPSAPPAIFWRQPPGPIPAGTPILVAPTECFVAVLGGAVLGMLAPGSYTLHPQALPFLAPSLDAASNVTAELWFVFTGEFRGCKFGGPLETLIDPLTMEQVTPLVHTGEYSMKVIDPTAFVKGHIEMTDGAMVVAAVNGEALRKTKEIVARFVGEGHSVLQLMGDGTLEKLRAMLGDLTSVGLAVHVQSLTFGFSDEDRKLLIAANAVRSKAMRAAKIAEIQAQEAASSPTGGAPFVAPTPGAAVPPLPPSKRKSGLIVGGLVGVVVLASIAAVALHHSRAQPSAAPQHHGKH
jgi:membrane protease subunit (stomatin/prohibitin family)